MDTTHGSVDGEIVVVGGGMGGMAVALQMRAKGHAVVLVEKNEHLGGIAAGFEENGVRGFYPLGFGDFPAFGKSGSANFYATIAVSRSIDPNGGIYFDDGTTTRVFWNDSYLGKNILPFRWGTNFDFAWDKWSLYMDWYSDPYYLRDFGKRSENFDWLKNLS